MTHLAIKVPVIESERGWGSKVDDHMVCLTIEDAKEFKEEFNAKNNESSTPDWYMYADNTTTPMDINDKQYKLLKKEKRVWLSHLRNIC